MGSHPFEELEGSLELVVDIKSGGGSELSIKLLLARDKVYMYGYGVTHLSSIWVL